MKNQVTSSQSIPKTYCEIHKIFSHLLPHHCLYTQLAACCLGSSPFCFAHGTEQNISSWSQEDHKASTVHLGIWFFCALEQPYHHSIRHNLSCEFFSNFTFILCVCAYMRVCVCTHVTTGASKEYPGAGVIGDTRSGCWDQTQVLCKRSKHS